MMTQLTDRSHAAAVSAVAFLLAIAAATAGAQTADEVLAQADRIFTLDRVWSRSVMEITRSGRTQAPQEIESYSLTNGDTAMALSVFTSPARVRGTAYLMIGDDLWVRFASTGRVRKLSSSARRNSAAGSDFSYNDMGEGSSSFTDGYDAVLDGRATVSGHECWRVVLTPQRSNRDGYERLVAYVTTDDPRYLRIEYFDSGARIKTMDLDDFRDVAGIRYPHRISMTSHERDSVTVITTEEIEFDSDRVREEMFAVSYLDTIR